MDNTMRCPVCHKVPELKIDGPVAAYTLICEQHGHEASGDSLEQARVHWNQYISFVAKAA